VPWNCFAERREPAGLGGLKYQAQQNLLVKRQQVVRHIPAGFFLVGVVFAPYPLHLQIQEEALHRRVVPGYALSPTARETALRWFSQQFPFRLMLHTILCFFSSAWHSSRIGWLPLSGAAARLQQGFSALAP
jgi:hypothetical protein